MRGEQGVGEARWSIFPDSPGCGEPCLKESVCIYYSKPLQSQGADFLLLFLPRPSAPCYRVGSVCRPGLSKGPGRAPTSQSDSCSVKCGGNRSHNCTAQKQKSARWQWGPVSALSETPTPSFGGRRLGPTSGPRNPAERLRRGLSPCAPGGPRPTLVGGEDNEVLPLPHKAAIAVSFQKAPLVTKEPFRLPSAATLRAACK